MSRLIVARFDNQFAATSVSDKLLSRGMRPAHIVIQVDESVGNSSASASAPTSIVSLISHLGHRQGEKSSEFRSPSSIRSPALIGHSVVSVVIDGGMAADDVRQLMQLMGATSIELREGDAPIENPLLSPEHGSCSPLDLERAICASRGGASLGPHVRH
jgi:hypothetical protein